MGIMSEYNVKKTNVLKLYKYVKKHKDHVKKEKLNGKHNRLG